MREEPKVTIITVTYNLIKCDRKDTFLQCVNSVCNQTYKNVEHIVIDGASDDGTIELIEGCYKTGLIKKYISEPDGGIYDAMNKGIAMAKGKYIAFLNSDDFYNDESAIAKSVEILEFQQADFSYANYNVIDVDKKYLVIAELESFIYKMPFGHPTMFLKTSILRSLNGFNERYGLPADYDLVIRLILGNYKGAYLNRDVVSYRTGGLGCVNKHSDDIAEIYLASYSDFFSFADKNQAKDIILEKIPSNFSDKFLEFAKAKGLNNLDLDKAYLLLKIREADSAFMKKIREMFFCISYLLKQIKIINRIKIYPTGFLSPKDYINKKELDCGNEKIPVFLSADENYAPFVATTMYSILKNTKSFVEFYILDGGISLKNQEKIKTLGKHFKNFSIEFIKIDTAKLFAGFPTRLHFSIDMYTRYLIPELKPQLKKVIYSDVDVIFNGDIKEAFQEDLSGYALGAVPYLYGYLNPDKNEIKSYHKRLGLSVSHKYFESGFLIIDTEVWRKMKITKKLLLKVKENKNIILTPDQDLLNIFFENNYKKLDSKYIVVPHRENIMLLNEATRKSIHDPFVIHFAGSSKPWKYPKMKQGEYFWDCASGTKFYDTLVYDSISIFSFNKAMEFPNKILKKIYNKIIFAILNPKKLIKKYMNIILHGRLRQPIRVVYYALRLKKLK